jgi:hypothetical protein
VEILSEFLMASSLPLDPNNFSDENPFFLWLPFLIAFLLLFGIKLDFNCDQLITLEHKWQLQIFPNFEMAKNGFYPL